MSNALLITVGFCPAWDITCRADGIDWGQHVKVWQTAVPAGKALNVSKALAWMGQKTLAAGLWGQNDWPAAQESLAALKPRIDFKLTLVPGQTRQNITVIDTHSQREMHLRAACPLATKATLAQLAEDLKKYINPNSCVAFSGSMPEGEPLTDCLSIIKTACQSGANIAADSSGPALTKVVAQGGLYAIKPNLEELSQLLGTSVPNQIAAIITAARTLCNKVQIILVSRGPDGAIAITKDKAIACRAKDSKHKSVNTVACGDYLLAGFLAQQDNDLAVRLENAVKVATARAWGLTDSTDWQTARTQIKVQTTVL